MEKGNVISQVQLGHYTPEQITKRRNKKDVDSILNSLLNKATKMLKHPGQYHYNEMMRRALVYMTSNWDDLIKYRNDSRYTIDNMYAEQAIRPFTISRKNSLFFSREDGVQDSLIYQTLIETCKDAGLNVKEYFTYVFRMLMEGETTYEKLIPSAVAL